MVNKTHCMIKKWPAWLLVTSALLVGGCASSPETDMQSTSTEPEQPETATTASVNGSSGSFVEVMPNFELLDPLYGLGSMGDFKVGMTAFEEQQYSQALMQWYPLAKDKDPRAEYYLGFMYINGLGLPKDVEEGRKWLLRSAQRDYVDAQYELGQLYVSGVGIEQNMDQAMRWLMSAARAGHPAAQFNIGLLYQQNKVPLSSNLLAVYKGIQSRQFSFEQAAKWYQAAAEQGHAAAQNNLAWLYQHGHGVPQNQTTAFRWYQASAEQGIIDAFYNLGLLYEQGEGVEMDLEKSLFWQTKAADYGYVAAQNRLPELRRQLAFYKQSLVLFGTPLGLTTREVMREKLTQSQALPIREANNYWFDVYESSKTLRGTDRLFAGYSLRTGKLASLEYRFPSFNDPNLVMTIIEMINDKYGRPVTVIGDISQGEVDYRWEVKDTRIRVKRYWPDTTVYLSYQVGDTYPAMVSEMPPNTDDLKHNLKVETY